MEKTKQIEKILEILQKGVYYGREDVTVTVPLKQMAKEIAALYKDYYPKEFFEWKDFETESVVNADNKTHSHIYQGEIYSIDALFQYWQDKVRQPDHVTMHDLKNADEAREERCINGNKKPNYYT